MQRRGNGSASESESYFFKVYPAYFKVDHGFAKTIKPNTNYRLSLFKGIQKADQLAQPIKGKLIGGKILFDEVPLNISLPIYMPNRNVEFTIKVLETKPSQTEQQIASHRIKSGDFIKRFKQNSTAIHREEVALIDNLSLVFDLFVHTSKVELDKIAKDHYSKSKQQNRASLVTSKGPKTPRKNQFASQIYSQSDRASETGSNNEGGLSSRKRLNRKRGHDGKLKSKHGSRQNSIVFSRSKSVRSDRKSLGPFPHAQKDQHFVHSPKKISPPHVEQYELKNQGKKNNYVSIGKRDSIKTDIKSRNFGRVGNKEEAIEPSRAERSGSAKKNRYDREVSPPGRSGTPTRQGRGKHELVIKTNQNMFDLERRTARGVGARSPSGEQKAQEVHGGAQARMQQIPQQSIVNKQGKKSPVPSKVVGRGNQSVPQPQIQQNQPVSKPSRQASKIENSDEPEGKVSQTAMADKANPAAQKVNKADSIKTLPHVQIKDKPISVSYREREEVGMKASHRLSQLHHDEDLQESAGKQFNGMRDKLFYVLFTVISLLLFWNALTPSRKV